MSNPGQDAWLKQALGITVNRGAPPPGGFGDTLTKKLKAASEVASRVVGKVAEDVMAVKHPILGKAQSSRADALLAKLPAKDKAKVETLLKNAKSDEERQYLTKGVAVGHTPAELEAFAKKIKGKSQQWMQDNLSLTGNSKGRGVQQQWSDSCNATTVEAVRGELDPIYALKMHEDNPHFDKVDDSNATKQNPKLAADQKAMLTSTYTGSFTTAHSGVAVARNAAGGSGRFADDLLNKTSGSTGITFTTKEVGGSGMKIDDAVKEIDAGLDNGAPVPIVIGDGGNSKMGHYVLITAKEDGPPARYSIHDPWSGKTLVRTADQIKKGNLDVAGWNQLGAIEDPAVTPAK